MEAELKAWEDLQKEWDQEAKSAEQPASGSTANVGGTGGGAQSKKVKRET